MRSASWPVRPSRAGSSPVPTWERWCPRSPDETTWVGNSYWSLTPSGGTFEFYRRVSAADDLFQGRMSTEAARRFVRSTDAPYLLFDCESHANLDAALASMVQMTRHFGCASVYRLG